MSAVLLPGRRSGWTPVERGVVLTGAGPGGRLLPLSIAAVVVLLPVGTASVPGAGLSLVYVAMALPAAIGLWLLVSDRVPVPPSTILLGLGLSVACGVVSAAGGVEPSRSVQARRRLLPHPRLRRRDRDRRLARADDPGAGVCSSWSAASSARWP
ncbi:hypothetical protein G5V59_17255 [Nocardioides sp. W3-2-3]|uniref:hypothetical protein n=1 Tax=Nocardioides convexus TaxID=2712224 RepID=UPI00241872A1|nr:hypothetical protein [Nocardioides convexus]NHA01044.1 hypothetical protein [Nocardioides convexus]